jgi:hypothetical protein
VKNLEVSSTQTFHNHFIAWARDTQKLQDTGARAGGFERLYSLANSGAEYKPARKNLVPVYKGENMAATWKFCSKEKIWW